MGRRTQRDSGRHLAAVVTAAAALVYSSLAADVPRPQEIPAPTKIEVLRTRMLPAGPWKVGDLVTVRCLVQPAADIANATLQLQAYGVLYHHTVMGVLLADGDSTAMTVAVDYDYVSWRGNLHSKQPVELVLRGRAAGCGT